MGDGEIGDSPAVAWVSELGSQTYGNPVVAGGKVLVGTNNGAEYRPNHVGDRGVVLCFDEKSGELLWQLTREKLPQGRVNDWPEQGICSTPCVEEGRMWVVTNRAEIMCVDMEGFRDGENDGPFTDEVDTEELDADIIWSLDMIEELGVFPHNLATSSPLLYKDRIYLLTSNGVDEAHLEIPSPRAPCFLCIDKNTGEIIWEDNSPFDQILHGQWGSPAIGVVNGVAQVYMPGGDGWLYAFEADADEAKLIWKFDLNPKDSKWELGGLGSRNAIISTPVFYDNSVILGVGQDPEHGEGVGHLYRIDATKTGDVTAVTEDGSENPNSGQIWHYGGMDEDGSVTGEADSEIFRRTISTVAVHNGLVYAADLSGRLHCIDLETGKRNWEYDLFAAVWGSPMVVDGKIVIGDEDGDLTIIPEGAELEEDAIIRFPFSSSIYSTPTFANGSMFVTDRSHLYAIPVVK
ncbi:MAG: PQQ-binding-like beta-propeller repeat protein [Planctomycetaceae bacterium]